MFVERAVPLKQSGQLDDGSFPLIGSKPERAVGTGSIIRMVFMNQLIAIGDRQSRKGLLSSGVTGLVNDLLQRMDIHMMSADGSTLAASAIR